MFRKLYDSYLSMDGKLLWLQIIVYSCLNLSFGYTLFTYIQRILLIRRVQTVLTFDFSVGDFLFPAISAVLLICMLPQLALMIMVKLRIDPYHIDPLKEAAKKKERERKRRAKKRKNRHFKNSNIISFEEAKKDL